MEEKLNLNEIVKIEQMPKVFEQLELIGEFIDNQLKDLDKLECTEKNKQDVKSRRTEISNTLNLLEDKRKEIKNKINEPYETFNKKYEETTKIKLQNAYKTLTDKINKIEDEQKQIKKNKVESYFKEYCEFLKIDFVKFEQLNLNITLSVSDKKLQEQVKAFLDKVNDDLNLINSQEHKEEILIEYKKNLNVSGAITTVVNRYKELEEIKKQQEEYQTQKEVEKENVERIKKILNAPTKEVIEADREEIYEITFKVRASKTKLKELKNYLENEGYDYESSYDKAEI